jgi:hypothetical protein
MCKLFLVILTGINYHLKVIERKTPTRYSPESLKNIKYLITHYVSTKHLSYVIQGLVNQMLVISIPTMV